MLVERLMLAARQLEPSDIDSTVVQTEALAALQLLQATVSDVATLPMPLRRGGNGLPKTNRNQLQQGAGRRTGGMSWPVWLWWRELDHLDRRPSSLELNRGRRRANLNQEARR